MPFLHLPVQSGSDRMLAAMNRGHTADDYRRLVDRLRRARPDLALSSDFIVGHPGETDADHAARWRLIGEIGFAQAYSLQLLAPAGHAGGRRAGQGGRRRRRTPGCSGAGADPAAAGPLQPDSVGASMPVLFTGRGRRPGQLAGRSPYLQAVHADAPESLIGTVAPVTITEMLTNSLTATLDPAANPLLERACA